MNEFKIEIREKTTWEGITYYYLFVNDVYIKLSKELKEIQDARDVALDVYKQGKHLETIVEKIIL
jgi:hypothetical protein